MGLTNKYIKNCIEDMIIERGAMRDGVPSPYWQSFCDRISYVRELSENSLLRIREHTYHLTGDNYQTYYFSNPASFIEANRKSLADWQGLSEPESGIWFNYERNGKTYRINNDLIRYNRVINSLRLVNAFYHPLYKLDDGEKKSVLEIGAGYGGLAYQALKLFGEQIKRYVIVDLPEVLYFAAVYLNNNYNGDIYIHSPGDYKSVSDSGVILLPNYLTDWTEYCSGEFNLVLNVASFQEMTVAQVVDYLVLCRHILKPDGILYSWNMDRNPANNQEGLNVSDLLRRYFKVTECYAPQEFYAPTAKDRVRELLKWGAGKFGLIQPISYTVPAQIYKEYICRK